MTKRERLMASLHECFRERGEYGYSALLDRLCGQEPSVLCVILGLHSLFGDSLRAAACPWPRTVMGLRDALRDCYQQGAYYSLANPRHGEEMLLPVTFALCAGTLRWNNVKVVSARGRTLWTVTDAVDRGKSPPAGANWRELRPSGIVITEEHVTRLARRMLTEQVYESRIDWLLRSHGGKPCL